MRSYVALPLVLALTGCQAAYLADGRPNEESPYFEVPLDSKLVVRRELIAPAHTKNIFLQRGAALAFHDVNQYEPYCALVLHAKKQTTQAIKPDTFVVTKITRDYYYSLAQADVQVAQMMQGEDGDTWFVLATVMELQSPQQPDVTRLICAAWGLPQQRSNVTVRAIRGSIGDLISLELSDKPVSVPRSETRPRSY